MTNVSALKLLVFILRKVSSYNVFIVLFTNITIFEGVLQYANNKCADQPAHVIHCLESIIPHFSISEISSLYLVSVAAQASLSLTWSQTPKTSFLVTRPI